MRKFCYRGGELPLDRCYLFGILNVTPDSFSDGGQFTSPAAIEEQMTKLCAGGADVLDLGCESTRPGYTPIDCKEELTRIKMALPLLRGCGLPLSIDTLKPACARYALQNGAVILNTVCDITKTPQLVEVAAEFEAGLIITHNRPCENLEADMLEYFTTALQLAKDAGLPVEYLCFDPGVGFAKEERQSAEAVALLPKLREMGPAVMLAASRKRLIGAMSGAPMEEIERRDFATAVLSAIGDLWGADFIRVHNAAQSRAALNVSQYLKREIKDNPGKMPING